MNDALRSRYTAYDTCQSSPGGERTRAHRDRDMRADRVDRDVCTPRPRSPLGCAGVTTPRATSCVGQQSPDAEKDIARRLRGAYDWGLAMSRAGVAKRGMGSADQACWCGRMYVCIWVCVWGGVCGRVCVCWCAFGRVCMWVTRSCVVRCAAVTGGSELRGAALSCADSYTDPRSARVLSDQVARARDCGRSADAGYHTSIPWP